VRSCASSEPVSGKECHQRRASTEAGPWSREPLNRLKRNLPNALRSPPFWQRFRQQLPLAALEELAIDRRIGSAHPDALRFFLAGAGLPSAH
jgi:hypothetical protein